jgi:hypothetical protein
LIAGCGVADALFGPNLAARRCRGAGRGGREAVALLDGAAARRWAAANCAACMNAS